MKRLGYNQWMSYIHKSLNPKTINQIEYEFGVIGKRNEIQIQEEISYLRELDKDISNKVRASYSIKR